jgi:hypothetical protein
VRYFLNGAQRRNSVRSGQKPSFLPATPEVMSAEIAKGSFGQMN